MEDHRELGRYLSSRAPAVGGSIRQVFEVAKNSAFARLGFENNVAIHNEVADGIDHVVVPEVALSTRATGSPQQMEGVILPEGTVNAPYDFAPFDRNTIWFLQRSTLSCFYSRAAGESITLACGFLMKTGKSRLRALPLARASANPCVSSQVMSDGG
jgi:hypothetical protein